MSKGDTTRTHDWPSFRTNYDAIDWGGQENGRREGVPEKAESSPGDSPSPHQSLTMRDIYNEVAAG